MAPELRDALDGHLHKVSATLLAASEIHRVAKERELEDFLPITNASVFTALAHLDLGVLLWDLHEYESEADAPSYWRRRLQARTLVLLLYEVSRRLPKVLGGDFRRAVTAIGGHDSLPALNAVHGRVTAFAAEYGSELSTLRNSVVAHRDCDASAQLEALAFDVTRVHQLGWVLFQVLAPLYDYLAALNRRITAIAQNASAGARGPDPSA